MGFDLNALLDTRAGSGFELYSRYLNPALPRALHAIDFQRRYVRGEGAYLYDDRGRRYLDALAGFGVFAFGRNHPEVRRALHDLLDRELADMVQLDTPLLPGLLAERLLAYAPGLDRAYFSNSGTESVEAALKFARYVTKRPTVVYCDHGFHGLTAGSLSVNGSADFRRGFAPLLPDAKVALGDLDALRRRLRRGDVAAFLVEPVQGKGVHLPPPGFLAAAQELLRSHGALLICDEVQTGVGRTGRFFAYEHEGVQPDIVTVAKALSGGFVPVGATLARDDIFRRVYASMDRALVHDSTFGAGALAMTAALAALAVVEDEGLVARAEQIGQRLLGGLRDLVDRHGIAAQVRGRGLMVGIEFTRPDSGAARATWSVLRAARRGLYAQSVVVALFQRHRLLTQVSGDHIEVIKLIPPLTIGDEELTWILSAFDAVFADLARGPAVAWELLATLARQSLPNLPGAPRFGVGARSQTDREIGEQPASAF